MPAAEQKPSKRTGFRGPHPDVGKATQIKPGECRNPSGKNQYTPFTDMYRKIMKNPEMRKEIEKSIYESLRSPRMAGVLSRKEAADRVEGPVIHQVNATVTVSISETIRKARERAANR